MNRARKEIEAHGVRIVLIGQATPRHAAHYKRRYAPDLEILADEKRASYKTMRLPRATMTQLVGPKSLAKGVLRGASGVGIGRPVGDPAQLGATMLVLPGGEIKWSHVQRDASDNPSIDAVLEALTEALG